MSINEEIASFVSQMFDKFTKVGANFKGTFLEKEFTENFESIYLQMKYISENLGKNIISGNRMGELKHLPAFRRGEIFRKIVFKPLNEIKELKENPFFVWQEYKEELLTEEYIDLVLMSISSLFEVYRSLLKNKQILDCVLLANKLGKPELIPKIDNVANLEKLFEELSAQTNAKYGKTTKSLFSMLSYEVRCSYFHMTYSYKSVPPHDFKIILNEDGSDEIKFTELINLTKDILTKLNIIIIVPYYFSISKLPLKGF